jgi:CTP:molybdopterin cytidylyltransferase MocA
MLVRFDSKAGTLTMFGDVGVHLLKLMGHSGTVPSAILAADIPAAVARLERALAEGAALPEAERPRADDEQATPVSLRQRAFPLIELLRRAAAKQADVLWDKG